MVDEAKQQQCCGSLPRVTRITFAVRQEVQSQRMEEAP
jgi:hypothetical protein